MADMAPLAFRRVAWSGAARRLEVPQNFRGDTMARARVLWPILLSVSELADAMGCDRRYVRKMLANGMPVQKIGVKKRILVADAVEHIRKNFQMTGVPNEQP
jgi:hypothetical protein